MYISIRYRVSRFSRIREIFHSDFPNDVLTPETLGSRSNLLLFQGLMRK